jgi:glutathione S-transferase
MGLVGIVVAIAVAEYLVFVFLCGQARARAGVPAPATSGDPTFERYFRVQQNTVEQLVAFVPGIVLFGHFVSEPIAAGIGLVFVLGRGLYAHGYYQDPAKRGPGFGLTVLANIVLTLGGLGGAIVAYL